MKPLTKKFLGGSSKGQITMVNLMALLMALILYIIFMPILNPMIDGLEVYLTLHPSVFSDVTIMLLRFVPFVFLVSICMTALNYAIPRREGY